MTKHIVNIANIDYLAIDEIKNTAFADINGGYNNYLFCCTLGAYEKTCADKFDYDLEFIIIDSNEFVYSIQKAIDSNNYCFAPCVYSKDKVIVGETAENYNFNIISPHLLTVVNM